MLRTAGKIVGAAAGVAATGAPSQAQCRAQQQRQRVLPGPKEESAKAALPVCKPAELEVDGGWVLPDLDQLEECLAGGQSVLAPEEIDGAVQLLLGYSGAKQPEDAAGDAQQPGGSSSAGGSDAASDSASEVFDAEEVDCQFRAAEVQLRDAQRGSAVLYSTDFTHMVSTLLQDTGVQSACLQALRRDPAFKDFCRAAEQAHAAAKPLPPLPSLLPPIVRPSTEQQQGAPPGAGGFFQSLAHGAINLAQSIGSAAAGARDALGRLFLGLGQNIQRLLNGGEQAAEGKGAGEAGAESAQERQVGNLVIACAIAVFSLIVLKRVTLVRPR